MSVAAVAGAIALAYPIIDSMVHEVNSKKAAKLRSQLNAILTRYNVKINDLRSEIERRGISYNQLMNALSGVSPAGRAHKIKQQADREYYNSTQQANQAINQLQKKQENINNIYGSQAEKLESKGVIRTITGDIIG